MRTYRRLGSPATAGDGGSGELSCGDVYMSVETGDCGGGTASSDCFSAKIVRARSRVFALAFLRAFAPAFLRAFAPAFQLGSYRVSLIRSHPHRVFTPASAACHFHLVPFQRASSLATLSQRAE